MIMDQVRKVWDSRGRKLITMNEILNQVNKRDIMQTTKAELFDTLTYYQSLSVVYMDKDENVMFL